MPAYLEGRAGERNTPRPAPTRGIALGNKSNRRFGTSKLSWGGTSGAWKTRATSPRAVKAAGQMVQVGAANVPAWVRMHAPKPTLLVSTQTCYIARVEPTYYLARLDPGAD
jgi:hypothetical protein